MTAQPSHYHPTTYQPQLASITFHLASLLEARLVAGGELDEEKWDHYARLWLNYAKLDPDVIVCGVGLLS